MNLKLSKCSILLFENEGNTKTDVMSIWPEQWLAEGGTSNEFYCKHDMQFYEHTMRGQIDWKFVEQWCTLRIITLINVMQIKSLNSHKTPAFCRDQLVKILKRNAHDDWAHLFEANGSDEDTPLRIFLRQMDNVSHTLLRLFFIQGDEPRLWFEKMESLLFRWRLESLNNEGIVKFRAINNMQFPALNDDEKQRLRNRIAPLMDEPSKFDETTFYKVSAFEVPELVRKRSVHLEKGIAFISESQFRPLIHHRFKRKLSEYLQKNAAAFYHLRNDPRFVKLGATLRKMFDYHQSRNLKTVGISIDNLDEVSETSYPPCMRRIHETLEKKKHLRYGARVQYTVFLKSIGIRAEEAIEFYKKKFCENMSEVAFNKEHYYRFRHLFGLVGSRIDYNNHECVDIAEESDIGPNDCHGCFFADHDIEDLAKHLNRWNVGPSHTAKITKHTENKQYGKACAEYFHAIHECPVMEPILKPDHFILQSTKIQRRAKQEDPFYSDDMMD